MHPALAANRTAGEVDAGEPLHQHLDRFRPDLLGWGLAEECPASRHGASPCAIGQQAEVANAHEAVRHHVQQKASQEFVDVERHDLPAVMVGVVRPVEADAAVVVIDEPIIRQRDAVGVAPEVVEHLLRTGEGALGIHDPVDGPQSSEEDGEGASIGQIRGAPGEGQLAGGEGALQAGEIFGPKDRSIAPGWETRRTIAPRSTARDPAPRRRP